MLGNCNDTTKHEIARSCASDLPFKIKRLSRSFEVHVSIEDEQLIVARFHLDPSTTNSIPFPLNQTSLRVVKVCHFNICAMFVCCIMRFKAVRDHLAVLSEDRPRPATFEFVSELIPASRNLDELDQKRSPVSSRRYSARVQKFFQM